MIWAVVATIVALISLSYQFGLRAGHNAAPQPSPATSATASSAAMPADVFIVPDAFSALPAEWRTTFGDHYAGYAILFDPARRELIVEQCRHRGYVDQRTGALIEFNWKFCEGVLSGRLQRIDSSSAVVVDRNRGTVNVTLGLETDSQQPRLQLSFREHEMMLIPGSKNDLLQEIENSQEMLEQKDKYLRTLAARDAALRRVNTEPAGMGQAREVPTYSLPETD